MQEKDVLIGDDNTTSKTEEDLEDQEVGSSEGMYGTTREMLMAAPHTEINHFREVGCETFSTMISTLMEG